MVRKIPLPKARRDRDADRWHREFWARKRAEEKRGADFLAALDQIAGR